MDFGQTEYTDQDTGKKITLFFPTELLMKLLSDKDMNAEHLTVSNVAELFHVLIGEWIGGRLQTEELSSIANFFIGVTKYEGDELTNALLAASELSYYIRHTNPKTGEPLNGFVTDLRTYYANSNPTT